MVILVFELLRDGDHDVQISGTGRLDMSDIYSLSPTLLSTGLDSHTDAIADTDYSS